MGAQDTADTHARRAIEAHKKAKTPETAHHAEEAAAAAAHVAATDDVGEQAEAIAHTKKHADAAEEHLSLWDRINWFYVFLVLVVVMIAYFGVAYSSTPYNSGGSQPLAASASN